MNNGPLRPTDRTQREAAGVIAQIWHSFSAVHYHYPDSVTFARARLILNLCRVIIPGAAVILFITLLRLGMVADPLTRGLSIFASGLIIITGLLNIRWLQTGKRQRAELTFTLAIVASSAAFSFVHGFSDPYQLALIFPLLVSGFLYGTIGVFWAASSLGALLIVRALFDVQLTPHLIAFTQSIDPNTFGLLVSLFMLISISGVLIGFLTVPYLGALPDAPTQTFDAMIVPLIAAIARYRTYREMYERAAEDLRVKLGYYYIQLFVYDAPSRLLVRAGQSGSLNAMLRQERRIALEDSRSAIAEAGRGSRYRLIALTAEPWERAEFLVGTRAELALPIVYEGTLIGVLDIHSTQAVAFRANEIAELESISMLVAFALRQLKQADEAGVGHDEQDAMRTEIAQLREQLNRARRETVEADWQQFLGGQQRGELSFMWTGKQVQAAPATNLSLPPGELAALTAPQIRLENNQQVLYVPIVVSGRPLGNMVFYGSDTVRWDERSLVTAGTIGQRFALLMENLRLIEESRSAELREKLINQVTGQLQAQTSLDALLATAAEAFSHSLGAVSTKIQIAPEERIAGATGVTGMLVTRGSLPSTDHARGNP